MAGAPDTTDGIADPRGIAGRLPPWWGSIRSRLTLVYSVVLFGLAAILVGGIYVGLARKLDDMPVSETIPLESFYAEADVPPAAEVALRAQLVELESQANQRAMDMLQDYTLIALSVMFVSSLIVGWFVAGQVLKPIGYITAVARRIGATDLSQRIALQGPPDELRRLADTFDEMLERLSRSFDAQRGFVEDASHELRNPLAVIRSNVDTTLADPDATVEDYRGVIEQVARSAERISRVVDDLVVFARHETRLQRLAVVDLAELAQQAADEFEAYATHHDVRLTRVSPGGLLTLGDGGSLRQALANLLSNALHVAPPGSEIRIAAGGQGGWVWISVTDEGPGIPDAEQELVFQRFQRGRGVPSEGRGLGLAIVRQIAESHRGEIRLSSREGAGSTFTMWLPATGQGDGTRAKARKAARKARRAVSAS